MYNGIGLQTPRGSGTNGYVQTNKFLIRGKTSKVVVDGYKGFGPDQGMGGISKKANKEILEHDRKRQIELKLVILEDKLSEQGYTNAEIAEKCEELRRKLEAEAAADDDAGAVANSDKKVSDTETHQIAARKEKQMEKLRAALGITAPDVEATKQGQISDLDIGNDDDKLKIIRKDDSDNDSSEREEGEILHGDEEVKIEKHHQAEDRLPNQGGKTKKEEKRRSHDIMSSDSERTEDSSASDSDGESKRKKRSTRMSKKNISVDSHDPDSDSDNSDKERQKNAGKYSRGPKRHDSSSDSDNSSRSPGHRTKKSNQSVISDRKMPSIGSNRSKRNELEKDDYGRRYVDKYYKGSDISAQGTNSAKLEPERSQRSRRRDINDDVVDSDNEDKKEKSHRRGRHDSEDEDSDVETKSKERAKDKEKQLRYLKSKTDYKVRGSDRELISHGERNVHDDDNRWAPNTLEDEQIYKKYEKLEAEDGTRKRERRSEGEHGSRKHESKEEGAGGRKLESKEDIDQERRKWEKKVEDGSERRKKGIDEDDNDRRKLEREEKDMHERRGQERREEDELRKRKLESSKNDEERNRKLEQRDADDYRSKKRVRRDENERGGRKGGSREEDEKQGRSRERRDEDELVYRKQGGSKREGEEDDDLGGKYRERREQEQRLRNDRKEHDRHGNKNRETLEEEGRRRRRHEREEDSPQKHETHRRDDVRRRH